MKSISIRKNIFFYYLLTIFGKPRFWVPVLYIYLTDVKMLTSETAIFLTGIVSIAKTISEIPTGVIADKVSKKASLFIGFFLSAFAMAALVLTKNYAGLFIFMALRGTANSFNSGADDALLYDTLDQLGQESEYKKHLNATKGYDYAIAAITTFLGGYLGSINLAIPIYLSAGFYLIAMASTLFIIEPNITKTDEQIGTKGIVSHTFKSINVIFSKQSLKQGLLLIFIVSGVMTTIFKTNKNIFTPLFDELGLNVAVVGGAISLIYLAKSLGAFLASKINKNGAEFKESIITLSLFIAISVIMAIISNNAIIITLFMILSLLESSIGSNLDKLFNDKISSAQRATILSIKSVFTELIRFGFIVSFGYILSYGGFGASILYIASFALITIIGLTINNFIENKHNLD